MIVLALGDVFGAPGLDIVREKLWSVRRHYRADICVVNGENASGLGLTSAQARTLHESGADVITLGNHTYSKKEIADFLEDNDFIIRPANYAPSAPGRGYTIYDTGKHRLCVINLSGQVFMRTGFESPFLKADEILKKLPEDIKHIVVDFHAEATSEKNALGYYLDGRVSAVFGTHTHIQTADERVLPKGTGYITDIGMTGVRESVLGSSVESCLKFFLGDPLIRIETASGQAEICGVIIELDDKTGKCVSIERMRIS
ncbi:MAG: TIGR00282 family metallophosphoesterase [Clostridiales bacterium]|nr:TIGR00282 family metallophosphoesterase [Clostridiales bacterium]